MVLNWNRYVRSISFALIAGLAVSMVPAASADEAEDGRDLYSEICSKCHGLLAEDALSWTPEALHVPAVVLPLGPPLTGVYLRPAGIMSDYPYSKSFTAMLENGWIWDEAALDGWLTNSQEFIRGSTMFLSVDEPDRSKIIAYLKKYARYRSE